MDTPKIKSDELVSYDFRCSRCDLKEQVNYRGTQPPFSRNVELKYTSYVMKDPFCPPGKGEILVIGSDCAICNKAVCINKECSIFYCKIYCLACAKTHIEKFPLEIKSKIIQLSK